MLTETLPLTRLIDEEYLRMSVYGSRRMTAYLNRLEHPVNRKRVQRLMRQLALQTGYPKPQISHSMAGHTIFPYLLRG